MISQWNVQTFWLRTDYKQEDSWNCCRNATLSMDNTAMLNDMSNHFRFLMCQRMKIWADAVEQAVADCRQALWRLHASNALKQQVALWKKACMILHIKTKMYKRAVSCNLSNKPQETSTPVVEENNDHRQPTRPHHQEHNPNPWGHTRRRSPIGFWDHDGRQTTCRTWVDPSFLCGRVLEKVGILSSG